MKKILTAVAIVILAAFSVFGLAACDTSTEATSITNLRYDGETIVWSSVKNAKSYKIVINNSGARTVQKATGDVSYKYDAEGKDFDFYIEAVIKEGSDKNPRYELKFKNLGKVEGLDLNDGILEWTDIEEANGYIVRFTSGDSVTDIAVSTAGYTTEQTGEVNYRVRATKTDPDITDGNNGYYSIYSEKLAGTILAAPTNIKYDSEKITWNAVTNAAGYAVKIDDEVYDVASATQFEYAAGLDDFELSVKAKGNKTVNRYDSRFSDKKTYVYLAPVTNLNVQEGVLLWDVVPNAVKYKIKLNGNVLPTEVSSNSFDGFNAGASYTIQVMPLGSGDFFFSNWSNQMTINILQSPSLSFSDNAITWNSTGLNAEGYHIVISKGGEVITDNSLGKSVLVYNYGFADVGEYTVKIKTTASADTGYYESKYSQPITIKRLPAPASHTISNNPLELNDVLVTFADVTGASRFDIIQNGVEILSKNRNSFEIGISSDIIEKVLTIGIKSIGSVDAGTKTYILDSLTNREFNITRLATPQSVAINGTQISWNSVNKATGYIIDVDGTRRQVDNVTTFTLPNLAQGNHVIKVRARGNAEDVCSSNYSNALNVFKLAKPGNLNISALQLTWDAVLGGATGYVVSLGGATSNLITNSFSLDGMLSSITEGQGMQISVQAKGNGTTVIDSDYSDTRTISKLSRPSNITVVDDNIVWSSSSVDSIPASSYKLYVDNVPQNVNATSYPLAGFGAGTYTVKVVAVGDNSRTLDSPESNTFTFTKLGTVSVVKSGNKYTWAAVPNASSYAIKVNSATSPTYTTSCEYTPNFPSAGEYSVSITAIGNGTTIVDGNAEIITQEVRAIADPSFIWNVVGNVATITASGGPAGCTYIVEIGGIQQSMPGGTYTLNKSGTTTNYVVRVKVVGKVFDGGIYWIDSNLCPQQTVIIP